MNYRKTLRAKLRRFLISASRKVIIIVSIVVFGIGVLSSYAASNVLRTRQDNDIVLNATQQTAVLGNYIEASTAAYRQALRGAAGMVNVIGRDSLAESDWKLFAESLRAGNRFGEVLGFGLADYIPSDQKSTYINSVSGQIGQDLVIRPAGERDGYVVIRYIEPNIGNNQKAIGFDMRSDLARSNAMIHAQDTNSASVTEPLYAVQDSAIPLSKRPLSLIMYYPIYKFRNPEVPKENRSDSLIGYVYLVYRPEDIFGNQKLVSGNIPAEYQIDDVTDFDRPKMIFMTAKYKQSTDKQMAKMIVVNDRSWRIKLYTNAIGPKSVLSPTIGFIMGVITSSALAFLIYIGLTKQNKTIDLKHEQQLQKTKDELLALASHQLRTPATGVRQYIGMLQNGYFGEMSTEQLEITKKAYRSNERQLEIIDQLLHVAKADAGQILLENHNLDIVEIVKNVVDIQKELLIKKNISIGIKSPNNLMVWGDKRYLTMIVENLVSNAIKYSFVDSSVDILIDANATNIRIHIKDGGVGIEKHDFDKLFKKFSRINNPLSRDEGGSGLGLFLAERLATAHQGSIEFVSRSGKGSTFTLVMPKTPEKTLKNVVQLTY